MTTSAGHPAPATRTVRDLRPLVLAAERRALRSSARLVAVLCPLLVGVGLQMLLLAGPDDLMRLVGVGMAALGVALAAGVGGRAWAGRVLLRRVLVRGVPATLVRRPRVDLVASLGLVAIIAAAPAVGGVHLLRDGATAGGTALVLVGVALAWPVLLAVTGRSLPAELVLSREGVRYRELGTEAALAWADLDTITVSEPDHLVVLTVGPGRPVQHRRRAWPVARRGGGGAVTMRLSWSAPVTDVARLVRHYAEHPADREELGGPAVEERFRVLARRPVRFPVDQLAVGDPEPEPGTPVTAAGVPVWEEPIEVRVSRATADVRGRLGVLGLFVGGAAVLVAAVSGSQEARVTALGTVVAGVAAACASWVAEGPGHLVARSPVAGEDGVVLSGSRRRLRLWTVASSGIALALGSAAMSSVGTHAPLVPPGGLGVGAVLFALPLVLLSLGRLSPGELTLTEEMLLHRKGWRRWSAAWSEVAFVQLVAGSVVAVVLLDGRTHLVDLRSVVPRADRVAEALDRYAAEGGPRGQTRDPETLRRRWRLA